MIVWSVGWLVGRFTWETMAETLMKKNVSWQVLQEVDNFDDNGTRISSSFCGVLVTVRV